MNAQSVLRYLIRVLVLVSILPLSVSSADAHAQPLAPAAPVASAAWAATEDGASAEVLVLLAPQAPLPALPPGLDKAARGQAVYETLWHAADTSQGPLRAWLDARGISYRAFYIVNALLITVDRPLLTALAARPEVARVLTNPAVAAPPEPAFPLQSLAQHATSDVPWGVAQIGAPGVWEMGYRGEDVVVAGQDTGYQWDHPALKAQYRGWDGTSANHDMNWHDAIHEDGVCPADSPVPCDDNGHGTHTMGTIVGDDGAGTIVGVAPDAQWIGCRNMRQNYGTPASYAECFEFFLAPYPIGGTPAEGDPAWAPDVINNSWSCPPYEGCDAEHIAFLGGVIAAVRAAGILVVASAGNSGPACSTVQEPPALYDAAFTVGATGTDDAIASFSSRGTGTALLKPDLVAPGVGVWSSTRDGGYGSLSGTSMAAPHVTGAAALLWSARPDLRGHITETERLLTSTALPRTSTACGDAPGAVPNRVYGWGRLDVLDSVQAALPTGTLTGTVTDQDSVPLPGASVTAVSERAGTWVTYAGDRGLYSLTLLSDTYTVTVSHTGYNSVEYRDILITETQTTTLDIVLLSAYRIYLPLLIADPVPVNSQP